MVYLQELKDKTILKLVTLKRNASLNMQWQREEHVEALNASKNNGTTKTIEELDKLHQNMEDKINDVM